MSGISGRFQFSEGRWWKPIPASDDNCPVSPIWVRFSFSDNELAQLGGPLNEQNVQEVTLILPDGTEYEKKGKLNFAASQIDPMLGTQQLRATFDNAISACCRDNSFVRA